MTLTPVAGGWRRLLRPGDWLLLLLAAAAVAASFPLLWRGGAADTALVRRDGAIVARLDLGKPQQLAVDGALGKTLIAVEPGRARVAADPGPRQYCVRQGWLSRAGEIAICAPSRISLQIVGRKKDFDSLAY